MSAMNLYHVIAKDGVTSAVVEAPDMASALDIAQKLPRWEKKGAEADIIRKLGPAAQPKVFPDAREVVSVGPSDTVPCLPSQNTSYPSWADFFKCFFSKW